MYFLRQQWLRPLQAAGLLMTFGVGCVADDPEPTAHNQGLRVSEEVFRMFCMRVARDENPASPDGMPFDAACDGRGPLLVASTPRLQSLLNRRAELVSALDQVFAEGEGSGVPEVAAFADNELQGFLASLIPFYDDGTMPKSTRALASVATKLLDPADPRGQKVLDTLARLSPRAGYRSSRDIVAAVRPMLKYPRMDQLSQELLGLVGEDGAAHQAFVDLLEVAALELAEPAEPLSDEAADKTTLHVTTQLLFTEHDAFKTPSDPDKFFVRRNNEGQAAPVVALPQDVAPPTPFAVAGRADAAGMSRTADGRAGTPAGELVYAYGNANKTLLAALMRDQKALLERKDQSKPAPVEKLLRGLRPLLGDYVMRSEDFWVRAPAPAQGEPNGAKGRLTFMGPNVEASPMLDLAHSLTNLLRYPETDRLLALLTELLDKHESEASGPVYAGLAIDKRADAHPEAVLIGVDGQKGTPQEFWDDLLAMAMRMAGRPGLFKDVIAELAKPTGVAQGHLMARFMKYKDEIKYNGAPLKIQADGKYSEADAAKMNELVKHTLAKEVVRMPGMSTDVGMNRSLFQRLLSTIEGTNKIANCNKEGGVATVHGPLVDLKFPNADAIQMGFIGCSALDPVIGAVSAYPVCKFVEQPNGAETHMRSVIKKTVIVVKDSQLLCAATAENALVGKVKQDIGAEQEKDSQIKGFTLEPTPEAIARFMFAPRTKFITDLFAPLPTKHGVPLVEYEPSYLFALEAKDETVTVAGQPQSFLDVSAGLTGAFDKHETFESTPSGELAKGGYMFADLLEMLHMHWDSRKPGKCPLDPATDAVCAGLGLTGTACTAGCTQSLDPKGKFYSKQTNLVSYEPLLIEALQDEQLTDILAASTSVLQGINITCEDNQVRDGVTILADFVERMLKPDPELAYFSDKRKYAKSNTCSEVINDASGVPTSCACPKGSSPVDAAAPASDCVTSAGGIVPRGKILPQTTPMHLVLDALNRFDAAFADPKYADRLSHWRDARSALVDTFLTVERQADANDPAKFVYRMANPRSRAVGIQLITWLRDRVKLYREQGADSLTGWVNGLPTRLASVLGHPMLGRALDLLDKVWESDSASREMAQFNAYLLDPANAEAFAGVVLAVADSLEVIDRDRDLAPAISFAALIIADNAFVALDSLQSSPVDPDTNGGTALRTLEVTRKIADDNKGKPTASPISRLLKNAVLPNPQKGGKSPLETLIDAIADVNRDTPQLETTVAHTPADNRKVFEQLKSFLSDQDRGLERLYNVIRERKVK